eukprot:scaffold235210_cov21-Prasinocladus_malaysianus.AAC.1
MADERCSICICVCDVVLSRLSSFQLKVSFARRRMLHWMMCAADQAASASGKCNIRRETYRYDVRCTMVHKLKKVILRLLNVVVIGIRWTDECHTCSFCYGKPL